VNSLVSFLLVLASTVVKSIALLVSYVTSNTFPMPLSEKDEKVYLMKLKEGDEQARNVLIERNLRLVAHIVKKFDNTGEDMDDLISIGTIGLIKAINTFDPAKKIRLATYAARCIENAILTQWLKVIWIILSGFVFLKTGIPLYALIIKCI
jgi:RNA polymerase sporulation-specific sigma factor